MTVESFSVCGHSFGRFFSKGIEIRVLAFIIVVSTYCQNYLLKYFKMYFRIIYVFVT